MKTFNFKLSIKGILIAIMFLYSVAFIVSFIMAGPNEIFNCQTLLLSLAILFFLILIIKFSHESIFIQNVIMVGFFLVYIIPRLLMYLVLPNMVNFPFNFVFSVHQINATLLYVLVGSMFIYAGFLSARNVFKLAMPSAGSYAEPVVYNSVVIFTVFLTSLISAWYVQCIMGISHLTMVGAHNVPAQLILVILNIDIVFFMGLVTFLIKRHVGSKSISFAILLAVAYYLYFTFNGSRGAGLRIVTMIVTILLCKMGDISISKKYILIFFTFLALSYCLFPFASQQRIAMVAQTNKTVKDSGLTFWTVDSIGTQNKVASGMRSAVLFSSVMKRIGVIDDAIMVLSVPAEPSAKSKYMNMSYASKNIANLLLPGTPFMDADINTSRVIPVLYLGFSDSYLQGGGYYSDFYTPWGIFFLIFGWWVGWIMLLVAGMGVHLTYLLIMRFGGKYKYHMGALCLFSVSQLFYSNMGMDHWIGTSATIMISGVFAIILFELVKFILNIMRIFLKLSVTHLS